MNLHESIREDEYLQATYFGLRSLAENQGMEMAEAMLRIVEEDIRKNMVDPRITDYIETLHESWRNV